MAPNSTDLSSSAPKRRHALTDLERRNIRRRNSEHPGPQSSLISWFLEETGHRLISRAYMYYQLSRALVEHFMHPGNLW